MVNAPAESDRPSVSMSPTVQASRAKEVAHTPDQDDLAARYDRDPNMALPVDHIVTHRRVGRGFEYLTRWEKPWNTAEHDTWQKAASFDGWSRHSLPPMLVRYWSTFPLSERPTAFRAAFQPLTDAPASPAVPAAKRTPVSRTHARRKRQRTAPVTPLASEP